MKFYGLVLSLSTMLAVGSSLQASTVYNYSFNSPAGDLGSNTHSFAPAGGLNPTITATGYEGLGSKLSGVDLYSKASTHADENGLGLENDSDHEIADCSFIMLDLVNVEKMGLTSLSLNLESTTGEDTWGIWGSNTLPSDYSTPSYAFSGHTEGTRNIGSLRNDRYIFVDAKEGNVLLGGLSASVSAPEPASFGLLGMALAGAGLLFRRRFNK